MKIENSSIENKFKLAIEEQKKNNFMGFWEPKKRTYVR